MAPEAHGNHVRMAGLRGRIRRLPDIMFVVTIDAGRRPPDAGGERGAVVRGHEPRVFCRMASGACGERKLFPGPGRLRSHLDNGMCAMAVGAGDHRHSPLQRTVNALTEVCKLLPVMAGEAVDGPDLLCVGELGRVEPFMTGNALQCAVRRQAQLSGIDIQGDCLPLPGHGRPFVPVAGETIGVPSRDGG